MRAAGGAIGTAMAGRRRAAARRMRQIAASLRGRGKLGREESSRVIGRATGELADLAGNTAAQAAAVLRNGRRAVPHALSGRMRGRLRRAADRAGGHHRAHCHGRGPGRDPAGRADAGRRDRLVSLHDPRRPADPPGTHRPASPGFGYKAQVTGNDDGIVLDYAAEYGAAPDGPQLALAITRVTRRTGQVAGAVTADRGYGQAAAERDLHELGVQTVAIPRQATSSPARTTIEHSRGFRRLVKWRNGSEGQISCLKRGYGWDRTLLDGKNGAAIWCGHGVLAHDLVKISVLAA